MTEENDFGRTESQSTVLSHFFEDCSVCYSSSTEGAVVRLPCGHRFHLPCIAKFTETNESLCCVCRCEIFPEVLSTLESLTKQPMGSEEERLQTMTAVVAELRSDLIKTNRQLEDLTTENKALRDRFDILEKEKFEATMLRLQRQDVSLVGLRHQIRVLEDVLSVRVSANSHNNEPPEMHARRTTRSQSRGQQQNIAVGEEQSISSVSAPSSVRRTGARSLLMRKWRVFRSTRAAHFSNIHPELSRRAIQDLVRSEWNRMTTDEKNAVEL